MKKIIDILKMFILYIKYIFKNTRGIRIVKCKVDEYGRKIVEFQTLGSFHTEEMEYDDYRKVLIYDTEPMDVEKASVFFYTNNFEQYKIYSYDPINSIIEICDKKMKNIIKITGENWQDSVKYFKNMRISDIKQIVNLVSVFETNRFQNSYENNYIIELEDKEKKDRNIDIKNTCDNIFYIHQREK